MIKVVARNHAQEEKLQEILEMYKEMVELTRKENGCIKYELYQDTNNPAIITMIEEWESRSALEAHLNSEHFLRIIPQVKPFMIKPTDMNIYTQLI